MSTENYALANGNWSNDANWSLGHRPTTGEDGYANGKTVTIDVTATCDLVTTAAGAVAVAGGGFTLSSGITLTAAVTAGTTACVTPGASSVIVGAVTAGGSASAYGVYSASTVTVTITGAVTGGSGGNASGVGNNSTGTITITGAVTGGSVASAYGANNNSTGTITIIGAATGGSAGAGANNAAGGTLTATTAVGNGFGYGSTGLSSTVGVAASQASITKVNHIEYGSLGQSPTSGPVFLDPDDSTCQMRESDLTTRTLVDAADLAPTEYPNVSDVRSGTVYGSGTFTGTCNVPAAGSVALGVPVDATVGSAVITAANVLDVVGPLIEAMQP